MMTEALNKKIQLPVWLITMTVTIILALFAFNTQYATNSKQIQINTDEISEIKTREIQDLRNNKADKDVMNLILQRLDRIENKLDKINK
jgi:hypothetical protein